MGILSAKACNVPASSDVLREGHKTKGGRMKKWVPTSLLKGLSLGFFSFSLVLAVIGSPLQAAEPIRVGAIFSVTGWAAAIGTPPKEAVSVVVDEVNRKG